MSPLDHLREGESLRDRLERERQLPARAVTTDGGLALTQTGRVLGTPV